MNLHDLVKYAQERSGTPDRPVEFPEPSWIPVGAVELVRRGLDRRDGDRTNDQTDTVREDNRVQVLRRNDSLGIEAEDDQLRPPAGGVTDVEVQHQGTDALAFYLPFHHYRTVWGIYLRASGIQYLAQELKEGPLGNADSLIIQASANVLHAHERHHFAVEAASTLLEVGLVDNVYKIQCDAAADHKIRQTEEALSNARCRNALQRSMGKTLLAALDRFMRSQGPGYKDFHLYQSPKKFCKGRQELGELICKAWRNRPNYCEHSAVGVIHALFDTPWPWEAYHEMVEVMVRRWDVPRYLIRDTSVPWLRVLRPFPKDVGIQVFVYSNDHRPVHFHLFMPPGEEYGRYQWPSLEPLGKKDPALSNKTRKALVVYLNKYGSDIRQELANVYGAAAVSASI